MPQEIRDKISRAQKGKPKSAETRLKMSLAARRRCQSTAYRAVLAKRIKAQWQQPQFREAAIAAVRGRRHSLKARELIALASRANWKRPEYRDRMIALHRSLARTAIWNQRVGDAQRGPKGNNWQGGKTALSKRLRHSARYRQWREAVYARDNWTCQECNARGVEIHPHHIKAFATHPELRFDVANGQTLCVSCHKKTDTYARSRPRKEAA